MKGLFFTVNGLFNQTDVYSQRHVYKSITYANSLGLYVDLTCYITSL
jgi:hypothetical protein